jgi:hypothetical protein
MARWCVWQELIRILPNGFKPKLLPLNIKNIIAWPTYVRFWDGCDFAGGTRIWPNKLTAQATGAACAIAMSIYDFHHVFYAY